MRIYFYKKDENSNVPDKIGDLTVKGTIDSNRKGFMSLIDLNLREFLKGYLNEDRIIQTGLNSIRSCGHFWSSFYVRKGVNKDIISNDGLRETILSATPDDGGVEDDYYTWENATPVVTASGKTDIIVGVEVFDTGFIVSSTANVTNIIGGKLPAYFTKITSKNFKQGDRASAKVFKDEKALLKYMKEKKDIFSYIVSQTGKKFSYEPVSDFYVSERKHPISGEIFDELDALFDEINGADDVPQETRTGDTPEEEALIRMEEMDLHGPVKAAFKKDKTIYMSEFGGAIYDLDENAQKAVQDTLEFGLPYHVIRNQTNIGDMYAVLFVSNYPEEWESEHRDTRTGEILANVYNTSYGMSEMGAIWVEPANGGLTRTA